MRSASRILLLLTASVVVCAVFLELAVLALFGEQVRFPRRVVGAPFGLRINEPGARYRHESPDVSVEFRINSAGLRADRDYSYEKAPGVRRIVSLGDSYTMGFEVEATETFSSVLERELRRVGYDVQVLNAGVSGYGTAEACLYLERELLHYEPDVVLVSFFGNDLTDNVRSELFVLRDGVLREANYGYVPAGRLGDLLNRNGFLNFLSERSNAFGLLKERATGLLKRRLVKMNLDHLEGAETGGAAGSRGKYARRLSAAIFERIYATTARRRIRLVIHSIPTRLFDPIRLVELFPLDEFPIDRDDLRFFAANAVLNPWLDRALLYYTRSQNHWTPLAHELVGQALAELIDGAGWLRHLENRSDAREPGTVEPPLPPAGGRHDSNAR